MAVCHFHWVDALKLKVYSYQRKQATVAITDLLALNRSCETQLLETINDLAGP